MAFWSSGGDDEGNGWGDDGSIGDLSDQSLEKEESSAPVPQGAQHQQPPPPPPPPAASGVALGGGLFMGRLTRFIETVTQPQEEVRLAEPWADHSGLSLGLEDDEEKDDVDDQEMDSGDGWDDEDDGLDFENAQEENLPSPQPESQPMSPPPPSPSPPPADPSKSALMDSGWDDDLDLALDDVVTPQAGRSSGAMSSEEPPFVVPLKDHPSPQRTEPAIVDHTPSPVRDAPAPLFGDASALPMEDTLRPLKAQEPPLNEAESGWDEDDKILEDVDVEADETKNGIKIASHYSEVSLNVESGWDDNDGILEDLDGDSSKEEISESESQTKLVDLTPPPPPPPEYQNTASTYLGGLSEAGTAASDAVSGSQDLVGAVGGTGPPKIVDHTPLPPLESMNSAFESGNSQAAVASSHFVNSGWEESDDVVQDESTPISSPPARIVDHTPLPPPPESDTTSATFKGGGNSAVAVAGPSHAGDSGWDDDDGLFSDEDVQKPTALLSVGAKIVDLTPPLPPPTPLQRSATMDAVWDGDCDNSQADTLSLATSRAGTGASPMPSARGRIVGSGWQVDGGLADALVDHTPSIRSFPVQHPGTIDATASIESIDSLSQEGQTAKQNARERGLQVDVGGWAADGALDDVDGIGQDKKEQTATEQHQPKMVDHTPAPSALASRQSSNDASVASMAVVGPGSSVAESVESGDTRETPKQRGLLRRMVDHTPAPLRALRGMSLEASLAAMGASSVGESLESINEEDEAALEHEYAKNSRRRGRQNSWNVEAMEFDAEKPRSEYSITFQDSMVIPFGAASPPSALAIEGANLSYQQATQVPVVDHTPIPLVKARSVAESVDALGVSSDEGDLDASRGDVDDVKEDIYGQVVDHTPATPNARKSSLGKLLDISEGRLEAAMDDTVRGVAERQDMDADIKQNDEMDESSHDASTAGTSKQEEHETWSLLGSLRLSIVEEHLVDYVPNIKDGRPTDASTLVLGDGSEESSREDDVTDDDNTITAGFGPIVDHTPSVMHVHRSARSVRSVATSIVTQVSGLETDIKLDEELDNTVGPGGSTDDAEDGWDNDEQDLVQSMGRGNQNHVVDHVPKRQNFRPPSDESVKAIHPSDDSTNKDDTIVEDATLDAVGNGFGPVVDHLPLDARSVAYSVAASMAPQAGGLDADILQDDEMDKSLVGASAGGGGLGWDPEEPDLEDLSAAPPIHHHEEGSVQESHLVDHVPDPQHRPRTLDASTRVLVDPLDTTSEVGDDEIAQVANFGFVVDQIPPPPRSAHYSVATSLATRASEIEADIKQDDDMDGTWFGTSTAGGASTTGGDGWDDDEELEGTTPPDAKLPAGPSEEKHMVDHVPDLGIARPGDMSTAVVMDPSEVSSEGEEGNNDENMEGGSFGAVVDVTPSEPRRSRYSVANSLATLVTGLEADIKRDDDMDSTEGGDGWDMEEPELEELADGIDDELPHLVDHVPERPDSRPTDASTLVVAEPSEMESQVDDFGQEEQNFGPVVDQTPPSQLVLHQSVAGSTIVAPPSEAEDDLDDDPAEAAEDATENNGWQAEVENPQAGNEDESRESEQLVDFLPPEDEMPELVQDGSSEMATLGEKSVLPTDDPKEDEFGPVVDHTPQPAATSPVAEPSARKIRRQDDDSKRTADGTTSAMPTMDSIAALFSVASKDKDDGLDDDGFGPVVDHLPTVSSRSSFPPSRGGSTVDALATVSEVDDDLNDGDAWEDDTEIDVSEQASPSALSRRVEQASGEDRNLSVKWVDSVGFNEASTARLKSANTSNESLSNDTQFFEAAMDDSSGAALNATRYYDPENAESNGWNDSLVFDDGDDTPPATPRLSLDSKTLDDVERGVNKRAGAILPPKTTLMIPEANTSVEGPPSCKSCFDASTTDCPCVQRILQANAGKDDMMGNLLTPEGDCIRVNFGRLLQDEITKRRLVEEESNALRATIETLKSSNCSLLAAGESQMGLINKLHESNRVLTDDSSRSHEECNKLRETNEDLLSDVRKLKDVLFEWEMKEDKWKDSESLLKREIGLTRQQMQETIASATRDFESREQNLRSELERWRLSNLKQSEEAIKLEEECSRLRNMNEEISSDLMVSRQSLSEIEREKSMWLTRDSALNAEIKHLKSSLENATSASASHADLREQIVLIQSELATKSGECVELKSQFSVVQQRLLLSEAENFRHTKDLARIAKQHDQVTAELRKDISTSKQETKKTQLEMERTISAHKQRIDSESAVVETLTSEVSALRNEQGRLAAAHEHGLRERQNRLEEKESELRSMESKLRAMREENAKVNANLTKQTEAAKKSESLSVELRSHSREKEVLQQALVESKRTIAQLQKQLSEYRAETSGMATRQDIEIASLRQEHVDFMARLACAAEHESYQTVQLNTLSAENGRLQHQLNEVHTKCSELEKATKKSNLKSIKGEAEKEDEIQALRRQVEALSNDDQTQSDERDRLALHCAELESERTQFQSNYASLAEELKTLKSQLSDELRRSRAFEAQLEQIEYERQTLIAQNLELQSRALAETSQWNDVSSRRYENDLASIANERDMLMRECEQLQRAVEVKNQAVQALEQELLDTERAMESKDQAIVIMKEQQKASRSGLQDLVDEKKRLNAKVNELEREIETIEDERDSLVRVVAEHRAIEINLNQEIARIAGERDTYAQERDMLEDDNEEMLVQFGLLKEQLDSNEEQLRRMDEEVRSRDRVAFETENNLEDSERRLDELSRDINLANGNSNSSSFMEMEESLQRVIDENLSLEQLIDEQKSKSRDKDERLASLQLENIKVLDHAKELQSELDALESTSQRKEKQLLSVIEDMEVQCNELLARCHGQDEEISRLKDETCSLRERVYYIEHALGEQERIVEQKEGAMQDLYYRLQNAGQAPEDSAELESLHHTIRATENAEALGRERIRELESIFAATRQELDASQKILSTSETANTRMEGSMNRAIKARDEMKTRMHEIESELRQQTEAVSKHESESSALLQRVATLESELNDAEKRFLNANNEHSAQSHTKLVAFQEQMDALKLQLQGTVSDKATLEARFEREVRKLQVALLTKDDQITCLKNELRALNEDLSRCCKKLASEEQNTHELTVELELVRSQLEQPATSQVLELTRDDAENVEKMRFHIVSLANALEKAESRRADAIERLEKERQSNADSLRQLTESVKRFYSTLSCGDV
jgi:chromosome segregation ATPase